MDSITIQDTQSLIFSPNTIDDLLSVEFQNQFIERNAALIDKIQSSDVVVLNGEGTMHGVSRPVLTQLLLVKIAKEALGKEVHIINHSVYPEDNEPVQTHQFINYINQFMKKWIVSPFESQLVPR